MINVEEAKVKEIIQGMHEAMERKIKKGSSVKEDIILESHIFSVLCNDYEMGPTKVAVTLNEKYGDDITGDEVIRVFRNRWIANPAHRKELFQWAEKVTDCFEGAVLGNREVFDQFEKLRKETILSKNGKPNDSQNRILAIMIYERYPEIDEYDDVQNLHLMGNVLAKYFSYDIADTISEVYGFPQYREKNSKEKAEPLATEKKLSYEQLERKVERLETTLERTNTMLHDLQEEFEEQLEMSKVKELADFFARLNSEKYGCILDELLVVRKGVDQLRKSNYELPIEINGLLIMVKKMIQFVRDSHIEPIMKMNKSKKVTASDVEFCNYEGSPFITPTEKKTVKVVSPGWIYKDKEIQISRPKVKEEEQK